MMEMIYQVKENTEDIRKIKEENKQLKQAVEENNQEISALKGTVNYLKETLENLNKQNKVPNEFKM